MTEEPCTPDTTSRDRDETDDDPPGPRGLAALRSPDGTDTGTYGRARRSANDPRVHFGLGPPRRIRRLTVRWPSGAAQSWTEIEAGVYHVLEEGVAAVRPAPGS